MTPPSTPRRGPLRVLVLKSNDFPLAGAARAVETYLAHLDRDRVEPVLGHLVSEERPPTILETSPRCAGMEHHRLVWPGLRRVRSAAADLRRVVRESGVDLVCSNDMRGDLTCRLAGASRGLGVPWCVFVHGWIGFRRRGADRRYALYEMADRWSVRAADEVWVPSSSAERNVRRFLPSRVPITILTEAIDPHYLQTTPERAHEVRAAMDLPPDALLVGTLGRMAWAKGHARLAEAVVATGCDRLVAVLLGFGDEEAALRRMAERPPYRGRMILPGARASVEDMPAYLKALDFFCFPSLQESFGLAVLEAMYLDNAVAASATGEIPFMLDHGRAGLLFPPGDMDAMVGCVRALATDVELRERLQRLGKERVLSTFDPRRYAADVADAAEALVRRTGGRRVGARLALSGGPG